MNMHMDGDDMKHIYNEWRDRPQEWMHKASLEEYTELIRTGQNQNAHQFRRSRFSTYLFQLSGCKFLLHKLIELPIVNLISSNTVGEPVAKVLTDLINVHAV